MNPFKLLWRFFAMTNKLIMSMEDAVDMLSPWTSAGKTISKQAAEQWVADAIPPLDKEPEDGTKD
jgi:hypothetical protein